MKISHNVNISKKPFYLFHRRYTAGQDYSNFHAHQGMEFLFVFNGDGKVMVNGNTFPLRAGTVFCFQPFQLHQISIQRNDVIGYMRSILIFDANVLNQQLAPFPSLQRFFQRLWKGRLDDCPLFDVREHMEAYEWLYDNLHNNLTSRPKEELTEICTVFMIALLQMLEPLVIREPDKQGKAGLRKQHYAELIMQWIDNHLAEPFMLEKLAEDLHLTTYHTSRLFRSATGNTITDYLISRRLREACLLLQTTLLSVEEVGIQVGMANTSHFCTIFRKRIGLTPAKFRKIALDQNNN